MQKYYAIDLSTDDGPMRAAVYKAADVDKYRNDSVDINAAAGREIDRLVARITELETELAKHR